MRKNKYITPAAIGCLLLFAAIGLYKTLIALKVMGILHLQEPENQPSFYLQIQTN